MQLKPAVKAAFDDKEFLDYAGSQGATTVTIWGGLESSKKALNTTSPPAVMDTCPWFVPTLLDWVAGARSSA